VLRVKSTGFRLQSSGPSDVALGALAEDAGPGTWHAICKTVIPIPETHEILASLGRPTGFNLF
jgi:hypothetical protein